MNREEKIRHQKREWYYRNKDKVLEQQRNSEKKKVSQKIWYSNKEGAWWNGRHSALKMPRSESFMPVQARPPAKKSWESLITDKNH